MSMRKNPTSRGTFYVRPTLLDREEIKPEPNLESVPRGAVAAPVLRLSDKEQAIETIRSRMRDSRMSGTNKGSHTHNASARQLKFYYGMYTQIEGRKFSPGQMSTFCQEVSLLSATPEKLNSKGLWALTDAIKANGGVSLIKAVLGITS